MKCHDPVARSLLLVALALVPQFGRAATPWERYVDEPSPMNARRVSTMSYSSPSEERDNGERLTSDIAILAVQVYSGDREAFRLTLRLMRTTLPGANLEDLYEIASRYVRQNPAAYLGDIASLGLAQTCPGVDFLGSSFVDRDSARRYELAARERALAAVKAPQLLQARENCLAVLRN